MSSEVVAIGSVFRGVVGVSNDRTQARKDYSYSTSVFSMQISVSYTDVGIL